jgi:hypothetical protein
MQVVVAVAMRQASFRETRPVASLWLPNSWQLE